MRTIHLIHTGFALTLIAGSASLAGCELTDEQEEGLSAFEADERGIINMSLVPVPANVAANQGCADWRWIGLRRSTLTACPKPPTPTKWVVSQLFSTSDPNGSPANLPPELALYCVYEWQAAGAADLGALKKLVGSGDLTRYDADCLAVSALGTQPLQDAVAPAMREWTLAQVNPPIVVPASAQPTRLAYIDDLPTREPTENPEAMSASERSGWHGYAMANFGADIVCNGPKCGADISSRLAIRYNAFSKASFSDTRTDNVKGGAAGMLSDLSQAIFAEIDSFDRATNHNRHMVLNLSLGWRAKFGGAGSATSLPASVRAVYSALEYASCKNIIAVAAAGNRVFGPSAVDGPWYPAAWESVAAPNSSTCSTKYKVLTGVPQSTSSLYRPLVYSAGGLSSTGRLFAMEAVGGTPRLAAFADHGVTQGRAADELTMPITGTSLSASITSATAALAWFYKPELRSDQIMDLLYVSDDELTANPSYEAFAKLPVTYLADYGLTPGLPVRRVDACRTMTLVCPAKSGLCPNPADFGCKTWVKATPEIKALNSESFKSSLDPEPFTLTSILASSSPQTKYSDLLDAPWLQKQPSDHYCPGCVISFSATNAYLSIVNPYSVPMLSPTLRIGSAAHALSVSSVAPGDTATVTNPIYSTGVTVSSTAPVFLSFSLGSSGLSVTNSILVVR